MMIRLTSAVFGSFLLVTSAFAQEPPPAGVPGADEGRYVFNRVQDGFLRLDTRNGQVSTCRQEGAGWTCRAAPDERTALESEIARLQTENGALKKELVARGATLPNGMKADPRGPQASPEIKPPRDSELDRVMSYMERIWRRLVEMMHNLQRDLEKKS
jgi:hypothetical protein